MRLNRRLERSGLAEHLLKEGVLEYQKSKESTDERSPYENLEYSDTEDRLIQEYLDDFFYYFNEDLRGTESGVSDEYIFRDIQKLVDFLAKHDPINQTLQSVVPGLYRDLTVYKDSGEGEWEDTDAGPTLARFTRLYEITGVPPRELKEIDSIESLRRAVYNPVQVTFGHVARSYEGYSKVHDLLRRYSEDVPSQTELVREAFGLIGADKQKIAGLCQEVVAQYLDNGNLHDDLSLHVVALIKQAVDLKFEFTEDQMRTVRQFISEISAAKLKSALRAEELEEIAMVYNQSRMMALDDLQIVTGVKSDYLPQDSEIKQLYNDLLTHRSYEFLVRATENIERLTGVPREFKPEEIRRVYNQTLLGFVTDKRWMDYYTEEDVEKRAESVKTQFRLIEKATGAKPEFTPEEARDVFDAVLRRGRPQYSSSRCLKEKISALETFSGHSRTFSQETLQEYYQNILFSDIRYAPAEDTIRTRLAAAEEMTGTEQTFDPYGIAVKYRELFDMTRSEVDEHYFDLGERKKVIEAVSHITGIEPDFHPMQEKIQNVYGHILKKPDQYLVRLMGLIEECTGIAPKYDNMHYYIYAGYDSIIKDFVRCGASLSRLKDLRELTGIEPAHNPDTIFQGAKELIAYNRLRSLKIYLEYVKDKFDFGKFQGLDDLIQKKCSEAIKNFSKKAGDGEILEDMELFLEAVKITGINPRFEDLQDSIQECYFNILVSNSFGTAILRIAKLRELTGVEPEYELGDMNKLYAVIIAKADYRKWERVTEIVSKKPDFALLKGVIQERYNSDLNILDIKDFLSSPKSLQALTGIEPEYDQEKVQGSYSRFIATRSAKEVVDFMLEFESFSRISPDKKTASELMAKCLLDNDPEMFDIALQLVTRYDIQPNWGGVLKHVREQIPQIPRKVGEIISLIEAYSRQNDSLRDALEACQNDVWLSSVIRLRKLQGFNNNLEHDAWHNELTPLLKNVFSAKLLSLENQQDAEILVKFVEQMGMVNLPKMFKVFVHCSRSARMEDIPKETVDKLENFGIRLKNGDGSWRYTSPLLLINELNKGTRSFQIDLLDDRLPDQAQTELGEEIVLRLRGAATDWERNLRVGDLAAIWKKTAKEQPQLASVPEGFWETRFQVSPLRQKQRDILEVRRQDPAEILKSQEVAQVFSPLAESLSAAVQVKDPALWWNERRDIFLSSLGYQTETLRQYLDATPDQWEKWIIAEPDEGQRVQLRKKQRALGNPQARIGFEKQIEALESTRDKIQSIILSQEPERLEQSMVSALEEMNSLKGNDIVQMTRQLSALHILKVMPEGWRENVILNFGEESSPSPERLKFAADLARQYISEHYLAESQNVDHIGHTPFAENLRRQLVSVWLQQPEGKKLPIEIINDKIQAIISGNMEEAGETITVSMVPVQGFMRVLAGDVGNACYDKKRVELAKGEFPKLHAWIYATNRGRANEALRGSALAIETRTENGIPALVVRANNPRENFIQSVNADVFVMESLREAVDTARRIRELRLRKNPDIADVEKRQCVVIPGDGRGGASTNRIQVSACYEKRFGKNNRVGLSNEPETNFNGYNIWDADRKRGCRVIWEIDKNGGEIWHGDWEIT